MRLTERLRRAVPESFRRDLAPNLAVVGLLLFVLMAATIANPSSATDPVFTSPRQTVTWSLAESWADTGRPTIEEPRLEQLPDGIGGSLTPRDGASVGREIVPKDFPLTVAIYAAGHLISDRAAFLITPLQAMLLAAAVGALASDLHGSRRAGVIAMLVLLGTYSFWQLAATNVVADPIGVAALLLGVRRLLNSDGEASSGVLAGLFFAVSVAARYTAIGPVLVAIGLAAVTRSATLRVVGWTVAGLLIGLVPMAWYHHWLYGGVAETGYGAGDALFGDRIRFEDRRGLVSFDVGRFVNHVELYLLRPTTLVLLVVGAVGAWSVAGRPKGRVVAGLACMSFGALVLYHGGQGTWGSDQFVVNASFLRYLLPVFALLAVLAAGPLSRLSGTSLTIAMAVGGLVITSVFTTAWTERGGYQPTATQVENQRIDRNLITSRTPDDAIVVTRLGSKFVFPDRAAATATFLLDGQRVITDREILVWEITPTLDELVRGIEGLGAEGDPVYLLNDGAEPWIADDDLESLNGMLRERDLALELVGGTLSLYAVRPV